MATIEQQEETTLTRHIATLDPSARVLVEVVREHLKQNNAQLALLVKMGGTIIKLLFAAGVSFLGFAVGIVVYTIGLVASGHGIDPTPAAQATQVVIQAATPGPAPGPSPAAEPAPEAEPLPVAAPAAPPAE